MSYCTLDVGPQGKKRLDAITLVHEMTNDLLMQLIHLNGTMELMAQAIVRIETHTLPLTAEQQQRTDELYRLLQKSDAKRLAVKKELLNAVAKLEVSDSAELQTQKKLYLSANAAIDELNHILSEVLAVLEGKDKR